MEGKMKKITILASIAAFVIGLAVTSFGQSTKGGIDGTVKDPKGAVVPGASVTVQGVNVAFSSTVQTNRDGYFRLVAVPTGNYNVTVAPISGFSATTIGPVQVFIEKSTLADITLGISQTVNVVEVGGDPLGVAIDTADSKVQTNITRQMIDKLPSGQSFTSLLNISPGTRPEPLSGGFQVDGASGSENTFLLDGQPLENFRTGTLNPVNNVPTSLVSEIQIKTGGFEAEHGGASGGVVSVATKSGSESFRGEVGSMFNTSRFDPAPRNVEGRFVASNSSQANILANPQYIYLIEQPKDRYNNYYPTISIGGPIIKKRAWFYGNWSPQISETTRDSTFYNAISSANFSTGTLVLTPRATQLTPINYQQKNKYEYGFGRVDIAFTSKLRGNASYLWNPNVVVGNIPYAAITTSNPVNTTLNGISYASGDYARLQGGRTSANTFSSQLSYTPTSNIIVNARYGRIFQNQKGGNYAIPNETRFICAGASASYSTIATGCPGGPGFQNVTTNSIVTRDVSLKNEFTADASYLFTAGGRHELKGGFQWGQIKNDVANGYSATGIVQLFYGQDFVSSGLGVSLPCNLGSASCVGVGSMTRFGTKGIGRNKYKALFIQDKYSVGRLTLNLGVRAEKEFLPSFNAGDLLAGTAIPGITQGWGKKIAPRLGGSFDVLGNGKSKIWASYGWFYDRLKFEMPRGSFGGDFYRVDYFPITAANPAYSFYTRNAILGGFSDPRGGGNPSLSGGLSQLQRDYRIPSNLTPAQFTALGLVVTGVDPDLKSFRQDEITVGYETELFGNYVFSTRYTRKNVAHAMEDHAILGLNESENYPVGNPGSGLDLRLDQANGTAKSAVPQRLYNGLEFIFTKRFTNNYYYSFNYTLSGLYGNYSGLASSDEGGRTSPGVDRFFDYPINGFTATGQPDNGYLATDRRHTFKAYGGYTFDWRGSKSNSTDFSFFQQILQGTPQTTFITVVATSIPLEKRGNLGRTPTFWQTDLALSHKYKFGRDNRYTIAFDVNATNAFNNNSVTAFTTSKYRVSNTIVGTDIDPLYDPNTQTLIPILNKILNGQIGTQLSQLENGGLPSLAGRSNPRNALFGKAAGYQGNRSIRFGFRFIF